MSAQPRNRGELDRVRDLVDRDPAHEFLLVDEQRARRDGEVGRQQQQSRLDVLLEQREVVLAEHAL